MSGRYDGDFTDYTLALFPSWCEKNGWVYWDDLFCNDDLDQAERRLRAELSDALMMEGVAERIVPLCLESVEWGRVESAAALRLKGLRALAQ